MKGILLKLASFLQCQVAQIEEGGIRVFVRKVKKCGYLLFMNILAPLAVHLEIKWLKAYEFVGKKNLKKLKNCRLQYNSHRSVIKKIEDQTIKCFKAIVDLGLELTNEQDWVSASRILGELYYSQGNMEEMNDVFQKEAEVQRRIAKAHQFDDLGIEFLPRYLPLGSIGNYEHLDAYVKAGILGLRPSKKLILLVDPKVSINNPCYLRYWSRCITVVSDPSLVEVLTPLEKRLTVPLNLYMVLNEKMYKSFLALGIVRQQWIHEKRPPILTLSDQDYQRGWQYLKSFGMRQGDWVVCLHVRERGWKDNNSSSQNLRNADINTYISAIKAVTDAGGWVVRMGDPSMNPLPQMPQVIDYAHSHAKSDWMDVFLCAQCRFFIGTSSGLFNFAMGFGKPIVMTNLLPAYSAYFLTSNDLFIPRICWSKEKHRFLSFAELISPPVGTAAVQCNYDHQNIKIIENSEEEIKDIVEEMLERCNGRLTYSEEEEELQEWFKSMTLDCGKGYGEENAAVNARIGRSFLRKYEALLSSGLKIEPLVGK